MARIAANTPCAHCPWRASNQGKRHPNGWYTKANLRRLWKGLRRGEAMSCHPTDVNNPVTPEDEAAGHRPAPEGMEVRECAGAVILCQREVMVFQEIAKHYKPGASMREYRRLRSRGLTLDGLGEIVSRVLFSGTPLTSGDMSKPDLNHDDVRHPDLSWPPDGVELEEAR